MPTPFMHLEIAERILADGALRPGVRRLLLAAYPAYYLGHVAPDYQTVSVASRETSHFYLMPPRPENQPERDLLAAYPGLARAERLSREHAVFVAAYCTHLILDLRWYREVLVALFLEPDQWASWGERFLSHNAMLTLLDRRAVESLPPQAAETLASAKPCGWLPFADDEELRAWRDLLASQLEPGLPVRTHEVYAGRMRMEPAEFVALLEDPAWLSEQLYDKVPLDQVETVLTAAKGDCVAFFNEYLSH
ncbi:MAG: zinc dependent phospholipase C family protein [Candidatus Promineifilaceae bacterium]